MRFMGVHLYGPEQCPECSRTYDQLGRLGVMYRHKFNVDDPQHEKYVEARKRSGIAPSMPVRSPLIYLVYEADDGSMHEEYLCKGQGEFWIHTKRVAALTAAQATPIK